MPRIFTCCECGKRRQRNPRLKGRQKYCGAARCQQSRKNAWERTKLRHDAEYKATRQAWKKRWRETDRQGAAYQSSYRKSHADYVEGNRKKQLLRNQKRQKRVSESKIVKTDGLASQSIDLQGLYVLLPWGKRTATQEIVKTDTLLVQVLDKREDRSHLVPPDG
jgi:hypothetical protein